MSGDRSPMSNERLPNGASIALHQGRWSWRGVCPGITLKTASQATHLCSWVFSVAWRMQTLQQAEAGRQARDRKRVTEREANRMRANLKKRQNDRDRQRASRGGFVWLLTLNPETKNFSPPQHQPR